MAAVSRSGAAVAGGVGLASGSALGVAVSPSVGGWTAVPGVVDVAGGAVGSTESRGSTRGGRITTPTTLSDDMSTNGRIVATRVSWPAVPPTSTTSPIGRPGA